MNKFCALALILSLTCPLPAFAQSPQGVPQQQPAQNPFALTARDKDTGALLKQISEALVTYQVGKKFDTLGVITLGPIIDRGVALSIFGIAKVIDWVRANELRSPTALSIYVLFLRANQQELSSQLSYIRDQLVGRIEMPPEGETPAQFGAPALDTLKEDLVKKINSYNEFIARLCPAADSNSCRASLGNGEGSRIMASQVTVDVLRKKADQIERLLKLRIKAAQVLLLDLGLILAQSTRQLNNAINRQFQEMSKIVESKNRVAKLGQTPEEVRAAQIAMMESDLTALRHEKAAKEESQSFYRSETERLKKENQKLADRISRLTTFIRNVKP